MLIDYLYGITLLWDNQSVSNIEALDKTVDSLLEYVASPIASSFPVSMLSSFSSITKDNSLSVKNVVTFAICTRLTPPAAVQALCKDYYI
jgi:hypothetical protein